MYQENDCAVNDKKISFPDNAKAKAAKSEEKKTDGCCPKFPLRFLLANLIFWTSVIIGIIVIAINLSMYQQLLYQLGKTYQGTVTKILLTNLEGFFEEPVLYSQSIVQSLKEDPDGFVLPGEDPKFNASTHVTSMRMATIEHAYGDMQLSAYYDDGSVLSMYAVNPASLAGNGTTTTSSASGGGPSGPGSAANRETYYVASIMSSTYDPLNTGSASLSADVRYMKNLTSLNVPVAGVKQLIGMTDDRNQRPTYYPAIKAMSAVYPTQTVWASAVSVRQRVDSTPFIALPQTTPMWNSSGFYMGIFVILMDISTISNFLTIVKSDTATANTELLIVDNQLIIYATSIKKATFTQIPYDPATTVLGANCNPVASSFAFSYVNTTAALCVETVFTYGFRPASDYFSRYSLDSFFSPVYNATQYLSTIYNGMKQGTYIIDSKNVIDADGNEWVPSFGYIKNSGERFYLGIAIFVPLNDYYSELNSSQKQLFGSVIGVVLFSFFVVFCSVGIWLAPLTDVAALMVNTAQLKFNTKSKFIKLEAKPKQHQQQQGQEQDNNENQESPASPNNNDNNNNNNNNNISSSPTKNENGSLSSSSTAAVESSLSLMFEIYNLQKAQMNMSNALNSFTKYLSREVVRDLQSYGLKMGMTKKVSTVLTSDINKFTVLSEKISPALLSELLTVYFEKICAIIISHGGVIFLFIGDAILCGWSAVFKSAGNDQLKAALCALEMQRTISIEPLRSTWTQKAGQRLSHRIGVTSGEIFAGVTGSSSRLAFNISGSNVELAQALEAGGKKFGTVTTVSEGVAVEIRDVFALRALMPVQHRGNFHAVADPMLVGNENSNNFTTSPENPAATMMMMTPSELSSPSLFNNDGNIQNVYELVGLRRGVDVDELVPPERIGTAMSSGLNRQASAGYSEFLGASRPTSPQLQQRGSTRRRRNSNSELMGNGESDNNNNHAVTTVDIEAQDAVEAEMEKLEEIRKHQQKQQQKGGENDEVATTARSNEEFLARISANPNLFYPAAKLFKRSFQHERSRLVVTELEQRFCDEWTNIVNTFAFRGDVESTLSAVEEIKKKPEFAEIFFHVPRAKDMEDYEKRIHQDAVSGDADQFVTPYEKNYRKRCGDTDRCSQLFIDPSKSEKLLIEYCQKIMKQKANNQTEDILFAMKI